MVHELRKAGLAVEQRSSLTITDDGIAGEYVADTIIERALPIELKRVNAHHAQRIDYLRASSPQPGLLLNVGTKRLEIERIANTV